MADRSRAAKRVRSFQPLSLVAKRVIP